jgi:hypothetical protein
MKKPPKNIKNKQPHEGSQDRRGWVGAADCGTGTEACDTGMGRRVGAALG